MCDIEVHEVHKLLKYIDVSKAQGPDGIAHRILKEGEYILAPSLTKLFNASLATGVVHYDWRTAYVTHLFKKGQHNYASNYRPISFASIVSKIIERIVCNRLVTYLNTNNSLNENQQI